jgi:hypothetical protein
VLIGTVSFAGILFQNLEIAEFKKDTHFDRQGRKITIRVMRKQTKPPGKFRTAFPVSYKTPLKGRKLFVV